MSIFKGKKVLLGITGGIAAYKSAWLARLFIKAGAEVQVVMTPGAKDFVTPLTLGTLSKKTVLTEFTKEDDPSTWNNHVKLGLWADFMVIAPATANTLSKMASGRADNLLLTTYLSAKCPVYFAPAMDLDMYFISAYPDSEKVEEAAFKSAASFYELSPISSRDQTETNKALDKLQLFIGQYPESGFQEEAETMITELSQKIQKKDFDIAKQYNTIGDAMSTYPSLT